MTIVQAITNRIAFNVLGNATNTRTVYNNNNTSIFTNTRLATSQQGCALVTTTDNITYTPTAFCALNVGVANVKVIWAPDDSVYVAGILTTSAAAQIYNHLAGTTTFTIPFIGSNDVFVVKYNNSGVPQWYARVASNTSEIVNQIAVDASSNVYIVGAHVTTSALAMNMFDRDGVSTLIENVSGQAQNLWTAVFTPTGYVESFMRLTTLGGELGYAIEIDDVNQVVYIGGVFSNSATNIPSIQDFMGNIVNYNNTIAFTSGSDAFLLKLNKKTTTSAKTQWMKQVIGATGVEERCISIRVDTAQNPICVFTGRTFLRIYQTGTTVFGLANPVNAGSNYLVVLIKYLSDGNPSWYAVMDCGASSEAKGRVAVTSDNSYYLLFYSVSASTINKSYGQSSAVIDNNTYSLSMSTTTAFACLVKYNSTGTYQWHRLFNCTSGTLATVEDIQTVNNNIYVTLRFNGTFSCTGVSPIGISTSQGTILLKVTSAGVISLISYSLA